MNYNRSKKSNQKNPEIEYTPINPTLQDYVNYLNKNPTMLLKERNEYTAEGLMMLLDNEKLAALEEEFGEHQNGIELPNFIWLMKCAIVHETDKKYELVNGLIKLFQDIDINGDKHMEWSEFTQYIIDAVIGEKEAKFFDARFEKDRELTETEILDRAYSRKTKRYVQSQFHDNNTHSNVIKKLEYSPHTDYLVCLEQSDNKLKFYSATDASEAQVQGKKFQLQIPLEDTQNAFIIDYAIAEPLNQIAVITSDRQIYFWENNMTSRVQKNYKMDVLLTGIWYLPVHKVWITAGGDYNIRTWSFSLSEDKKKIEPKLLLIAHMKQITDICELESPKLIASCSLDGKIKLWDIADLSNPVNKTELKDQSNDNKRGILGMNYSSYYGSNLLSYGFDTHINVWCPQVSITRAFIGKLEGHSSLVVQCKFIPQSPNVISVDDKGNIRIWDIRTMGTIQVITSDTQYTLVTDISMIYGKHDKFIVAGKRMQYYENAAVTKSMKSINDDLSILQVEFNTYFNQFVLLTKIDIRCYDAMTGKLKKVFNEVYDDKFAVDLCCFCFGGGDRKFYLADNAGLIRQYNMKNGEFLKNVNSQNEIEKSEFSKKQSHIKKKENNEISQIMYNHEEKLLIAAYQDSTIRIYDESDAEESVILKVLSGAHRDSEISSIAFSHKLNYLASGSSNGIIALWNFETGKCDNLLLSDVQQAQSQDNQNNTFEITSLQFADPYPILVSATFNGTIMVWGIGAKAMNYKFKCIAKIHNSYWQKGEPLPNQQISSLIIESGEVGIVPREKYVEDQFKPPNRDLNPIIQQQKTEKKKIIKKGQFNLQNDSIIQEKQQQQQQQQLQLESSNNNTSRKVSHVKGEKEDALAFQKYWAQYDSDTSTKRRLYIYYTDVKGIMHCLHLTDILDNRDIEPVLTADKKKQSFQLRRKDLINASKVVENLLSSPERLQQDENMLEIHTINSVLVKRFRAHKEKVNSITKLTEPVCYITCSSDKNVKIWSMRGEQYCQINLVKFNDPKLNYWDFPFNWVLQKLKDIDNVFDSLNIIDSEVLTDSEKEEIKKKYLYNKYFNNTTYDQMIYELRRQQNKLFNQMEEEEEKKKQEAPKFRKLKPIDPREIISQKIQDLDEHLDGIETKKANLTFTHAYKSEDILLTNQYTIKGTPQGNNDNLKAAVLVQPLNNSMRYNVQFRIRNLEGVIGFGICQKSILQQHDYEFSPQELAQGGHGMYIITTDLKAYSHDNSIKNNATTNFKNFKYSKQGDIVMIKVYPFSRQVTFEVDNSRYQYIHEINYQVEEQSLSQITQYCLVALVQNEEDEIEYFGGEQIFRNNRPKLQYRNMVDPKTYTEIKQRVGLEERPTSTYFKCAPLLDKIEHKSRPTTQQNETNYNEKFTKKVNKEENKTMTKKKNKNLQLISSSQGKLDKFYNGLDNKPKTSTSHKRVKTSQQNFMKPTNRVSSGFLQDKKVTSMSQANLKKNNNHMDNIIKEFDLRPNTTKDKYQFQKDIKYKLGEGSRQIRVASNQYGYEIASKSPQLIFGDNEVLTRKYKFYKELGQNQKGDKNMGNEDFDDDEEDQDYQNKNENQRKVPQIVATRNFWENPVRNQHKIFKTGQKIYVIEQD